MIIDIEGTTSHDVARRMVELRESHGAIALGRVLTLVVIADEDDAERAVADANLASHEHPSRVLAVVSGDGRGRGRLDAQIRIGGDAGSGEVIVLRTSGPLTKHPESVVTPLLLPDAPVVASWAGQPPENLSADPVGRLAQRRITNVAACGRPANALRSRATGYSPGDTDLAWSRITPWRALLSAALDQPPHHPVTAASVSGAAVSPGADLLAAWLGLVLDVPTTRTTVPNGADITSVTLSRATGDLEVEQIADDVAALRVPGRVERRAALTDRTDAQCLAEELRRLDPDDVYGEVLTTGLDLLDGDAAKAAS